MLSINLAICWKLRVSRTTHRDVRRTVYDSDNVTGADNQQERLDCYIAGFVDGEGSFSVSVQRNTSCRVGYQLVPEFHVSQNADRAQVLELIKTRPAPRSRPLDERGWQVAEGAMARARSDSESSETARQTGPVGPGRYSPSCMATCRVRQK